MEFTLSAELEQTVKDAPLKIKILSEFHVTENGNFSRYSGFQFGSTAYVSAILQAGPEAD